MENQTRPGAEARIVLFVVTEDWYFVSHRLPMALAAKAAGYRVVVATNVGGHGRAIVDSGLDLVPLRFLRRGLPLWQEICTLLGLFRLIRKLSPDVLHLVALKPVFFGTIAARLAGAPNVLSALTGLGHVFTARSVKARLMRAIVSPVLRWLWNHDSIHVVVQNHEDHELVLESRLIRPDRCAIIMGSGVDCERFQPMPEPSGPIVCATVCRVLADKGVYDLVAAARLLRGKGSSIRFLLAGPIDSLNPTAIREAEVRVWESEGLVEWLGPVADVREVWRAAHIAVLPSHREGLPKALLEAAACGRPIITTDTTGCREVVEHGGNGLLVPLKSPIPLAQAIEDLGGNPEARERMGRAGRARALRLFAQERVVSETLELYRRLSGR